MVGDNIELFVAGPPTSSGIPAIADEDEDEDEDAEVEAEVKE